MLRGRLAEMGYQLPAQANDEKTCMYYYEIVDRVPRRRPRAILKATGFACPPKNRAGLAALEKKIRTGEDISGHLSRGIVDPDNFDGMLLDWGIHHLHLGLRPDPKSPRFVERTGRLLYARFTQDTAYFIAVEQHGKWTSTDLLRSVHDNWPDSINRFRVKDARGLSYNVSDQDIAKLRRSHLNCPIEVQAGVIYCMLGSGITAASTSARAARKMMEAKQQLASEEKRIRETYDTWKNRARSPEGRFTFKLRECDGELIACAADQNVAIKLQRG